MSEYVPRNIIPLSSLCKLIWRHWTYKMPVKIYFVDCVSKIKHILSVIHYTIYGAVCFQFTHFPCDDWENMYIYIYRHCLIIIIKSEVWTIINCLGLGHEIMVSAVCLSIFLLYVFAHSSFSSRLIVSNRILWNVFEASITISVYGQSCNKF